MRKAETKEAALALASLYLISGMEATGEARFFQRIEAALAGGVRFVQLRERAVGEDAFFHLAKRARALTKDYGARLIINRRFSIAKQIGADGLHIPYTQIDEIAAIKNTAAMGFLVGVSTHSIKEARSAEKAGADFITLSPVYETPSKKGMGEPLGVEVVGEGVAACSIPVFGLGGVSLDKITEMKHYGITRAAMIRAILAQDDPKIAAETLIRELAK